MSAKDSEAFADTVIAKTFTNGSTLIDAGRQYLGENGKLIPESSKMLIIVSKLDSKRSKQIDLVQEKCKKYFQQESVIRVDMPVRVAF